MSDLLKTNPVVRFLIKVSILLILWYCLYEFWLGPKGYLDRPLINNLIYFSSSLLHFFGFNVIDHAFENMRTMGIDGTNGVWIGDACNGIPLFAVFTIVISCFPGPWKTKLWYIPIGILFIHLINIIRLAILSIIVFYSPDSLDFNHTYTFQILVYGLMFLLWIRWIKKYSGIEIKKNN